MSTNAVYALSRQLAEAFQGLDALLSDGAEQTDFTVMALRKRGRVLAADLKAALSEPVKVKPWSPWNPESAE